MESVVIAVEKSKNSKIGLVSTTYAPIHSCPKTCPFMDNGCYGQSDLCGIHLNRINTTAEKTKITTPLKIAKIEADEIRNLTGKRPLRLHVVGDCSTALAAEVISYACEEFMQRYSQPVWTYTHAWRVIPREKWGKISVLASCEDFDDVYHARRRGYAASMVRVKPFNNPIRIAKDNHNDIIMTPCLETTKGINCPNCRLCFDDRRLLNSNRVVCFFPHGSNANLAEKAIFSKVYIP
jgi:hypothetical protein